MNPLDGYLLCERKISIAITTSELSYPQDGSQDFSSGVRDRALTKNLLRLCLMNHLNACLHKFSLIGINLVVAICMISAFLPIWLLD